LGQAGLKLAADNKVADAGALGAARARLESLATQEAAQSAGVVACRRALRGALAQAWAAAEAEAGAVA
jgi:hypothetical protein